jgi:hypothetical protein
VGQPRPCPGGSTFLRDDLKLELSAKKTLITHARTQAARYLGYEIVTQHADHKITRGRRSINGPIALRVPPGVITAKCTPYLSTGKPEARTVLHNLDDYDIVATFGAEYRGIVQYYLLATDVWKFTRLRWVAETSLLKTLAAKHQSTGNSHSSVNPEQASLRGRPSWPGNGERP